jgi:hypothetical protein
MAFPPTLVGIGAAHNFVHDLSLARSSDYDICSLKEDLDFRAKHSKSTASYPHLHNATGRTMPAILQRVPVNVRIQFFSSPSPLSCLTRTYTNTVQIKA